MKNPGIECATLLLDLGVGFCLCKTRRSILPEQSTKAGKWHGRKKSVSMVPALVVVVVVGEGGIFFISSPIARE